MANLQVKNLPDDVHDELRRRAAQRGWSVRDYVLHLIDRDLAFPSGEDWLRRLHASEPLPLSGTAAEVVAEAREERAAQLDRVAVDGNGRGSEATPVTRRAS